MATKIIPASWILKQKGVSQKNFDTSSFNTVVANFFVKAETKSKIVLFPLRFIDVKGLPASEVFGINQFAVWRKLKHAPEADFVEMLDTDEWEDVLNDSEGENIGFSSYIGMRNAGLITPLIYVDEQFIGNAAGYLRDFCGFAVKRRTVKKTKIYEVSLPL